MAYTINKFNGSELIVLEDGTIDTSTSLGLVGRNYVGYGETQNENFVFLLENFANDAPPSRALTGQLWFDSDNKVINAYNGTEWYPVGNAVISDTEPSTPTEGQMWLVTPANQLFVYTNNAWNFIGPEAVAGFGTTRAKSTIIRDTSNIDHPVIQLLVNDIVVGICSTTNFIISSDTPIDGFNIIVSGLTLSSSNVVKGNLQGNASTATVLETARTINGVAFSGASNITISANTANRLIPGDYISGGDFNGSTLQTWNVDATSANIIGKVVARNSAGGFAAGTITADLVGNVTGNVTATTGTSRFNIVEATSFIGATLSGNAFSATKFQTARNINGVSFNGTQDIVVTANAQTLSGTFINSTVVGSSLTSVGTLTTLAIESAGITIGSNFKLYKENVDPVVKSESDKLTLAVGSSSLDIRTAANSLSQGWDAVPTLSPVSTWNLGSLPNKFNKIFATEFKGNADTATLATTSTNLAAGGAGSIPYQTAAGATAMLPIGAPGRYLKAAGSNTLEWGIISTENLVKGNHITLTNINTETSADFYNSSLPVRIAVDAVSTNTVGKIVVRDGSGNFAAGTITASLIGNVTGNVTGNAGSATRLQTPRTINGVSFDGTANITIEANDPNSGAPVGSILYYPTSTIPVGWLMCDGATISKTTYPLLFSKLGYLYGGSGDLFRLPDLRGEFIRGWDNGRGVDAGRQVGSRQKGTIQVVDPNYGSFNVQGIIGRNNYPGGTTGVVDPQFNIESGMDYVSRDEYPNVMLSYVGANAPLELGTSGFGYGAARPRNVALVACIKAFGQLDEPDQILAANVLTYVNSIPNYTVTSGNTIFSTAGFTNQVGSWNNNANYFDVFPPALKTMANLVAFIPSIAVIHYAGGVNADDSMRCTWSNLGDRIRVYVQNTEQRSTPAANYMAIWS